MLRGGVVHMKRSRNQHLVPRGIWALGLLALAAGCVTTQQTATRQQAALREDRALIDEKIRRVDGDVEAMSMRIDGLQDDLERIQANAATTGGAQFGALQELITALEGRVRELEAARVKDREEILEKLSNKIAEVVNTSGSAARPRPRPAGTVSEYGYEHVVKPGETLSHIAQAYGVSLPAIIRENGLENPNDLKIGQTLFIPE